MPSTSVPPPSARRWATLAAVVFAVFVTTLDNTVVNVALPSIQRDLGLGLSGLAWVVNGYVLSFAVLLITGGRIADTFGRAGRSSPAWARSPARRCSPASLPPARSSSPPACCRAPAPRS